MRRTLIRRTPRPVSAAVAALAAGLALVAGLAVAPPPASAQAPDTWVSGWGGLYLDPATIRDDESGTRWDFGTSFALGAGIQHRLGGLLLGADLGYSPIRHEVQSEDGAEVLAEGRAHLLTAMLTGRLGAGGSDFFTYLSGGIGAAIYGIPHLDRWDPDFAFRVGPGLEYRHNPTLSFYAQWNRWWVLHQAAGVDDNTVRQSNLEVGARYGF